VIFGNELAPTREGKKKMRVCWNSKGSVLTTFPDRSGEVQGRETGKTRILYTRRAEIRQLDEAQKRMRGMTPERALLDHVW